MKKIKIILLFFIVAISAAFAQPKVVTLSDTVYNKSKDIISVKSLDGWVFKKGNDNSWSGQELDTKTWKSLKPDELTTELADENGRLEGWFRIKIKFDANVKPIPTIITSAVFGASTVFINGKKIHSFGNTGTDASNFVENKAFQNNHVLFPFNKDTTYTIAIHYVDYVSHFPTKKLKSNRDGSNDIIQFVTNSYIEKKLKDINELFLRVGILTAIPFSFAILFWIIFLLNPFEKNIKIFAIALTLFSIVPIFLILGYQRENNFLQFKIYSIINNISGVIFVCYVPILLASVFKRNIHKIVKIVLISICIITIFSIFIKEIPEDIGVLKNLIPLLISLYYLLSSLRKINGAQWVIAIGYLLTLFFILIPPFLPDDKNFRLIAMAMVYISAPFSLMIYTSMRFKEMMTEVRLNAEKVTNLSEEKRIQAENQKEILEVEVKKQTEEIRNSLENLKETQKQLIQSEKMASLGELTAGIAHEIQNPLNFVNNFSEVSSELLDEMNTELDKGDIEEAKAIANDVKQNLEKINHHGKRADSIVKGMLQHSRSSSGKKELTDLNALCDEYLRLSYHGLRAKDKSFNATMITDFDESIGQINIIPQDLGRVVLNLLTNAFYVVDERLRQAQPNSSYKPTVSISTKKENNKITIKVTDNGNGMPQEIMDKIFQPFFTTKPTGKGTGLGLSMSYDIITKGHSGELTVKSIENEGTTFSIIITI